MKAEIALTAAQLRRTSVHTQALGWRQAPRDHCLSPERMTAPQIWSLRSAPGGGADRRERDELLAVWVTTATCKETGSLYPPPLAAGLS